MKKLLLSIFLICTLCSPVFAANPWRDGSTSFFDGTTIINDIDTEIVDHVVEPLERALSSNDNPISVSYSSASAVTMSAGSVVCANSGLTLIETRRNTSTTSVSFSNIDTGGEGASKTYYVYADCDADATTAVFKVSLNATTPSGVTLYKKLGSFYNDGSSNIDRRKIYTNAYGSAVNDSSGVPKITAIYNYATSASSYTEKDSDLKFAYGHISVSANSTQAITNLPFTSGTTYSCWASFDQNLTNDDGFAGCTTTSGASATIINQQGSGTRTIQWGALGY